ncbi:MAG: RNA polymerase sigma factor [Castellaniella sp.]|uniref:RNA polymerase sigma factor n=1 Tax=Castellaniella sp. TaxID=1955812 RepID=UPI001219E7D0|nr:RNA polymerase sigma factor [Castellaniella sp.]TAN30901.1 MAG: RNA polymerase sigma factor [Castellaniella sp.]
MSALDVHHRDFSVCVLGDLELIERVIGGEVQAFDALMRRYNQRLYRTARSILHDEAEAEDAVQDAWWKAYNHLRDFRSEASPATWLTRIVVNEALMRRRRNKTRETIIQSMDPDLQEQDTMSTTDDSRAMPQSLEPDRQAWGAELRGLIEQHIDALPDKYRAVFMLRGVEDLPSAEVAAALGIPEATVRVRYMRARRLMQDALRGQLDLHAHDAFSFAGERCDRIVAGVHARMRLAGITER